MKSFIVMSAALMLALSSCKSNENKTADNATVSTDSTATSSDSVNNGRKIIRPEGYNRGLPFTPGILVNNTKNTLFVAGFSGEDAKTGVVPDKFEDEVKSVLDKIGVILKEGGMDYSDVVSVQVYLTDMTLFERMNEVYRGYFPEPRPTRSIMGIQALLGKSRIEITVTAQK